MRMMLTVAMAAILPLNAPAIAQAVPEAPVAQTQQTLAGREIEVDRAAGIQIELATIGQADLPGFANTSSIICLKKQAQRRQGHQYQTSSNGNACKPAGVMGPRGHWKNSNIGSDQRRLWLWHHGIHRRQGL